MTELKDGIGNPHPLNSFWKSQQAIQRLKAMGSMKIELPKYSRTITIIEPDDQNDMAIVLDYEGKHGKPKMLEVWINEDQALKIIQFIAAKYNFNTHENI